MERIGEENLVELRKLELSRKPETFEEVKVIHGNSIALCEELYGLPFLKELAVNTPFDTLPNGTPQWFIFSRKEGEYRVNYLVNTEGYDYCRYVGRLGKFLRKDTDALLI